MEITFIGGNEHDLNVTLNGQSYGVWHADRGRWAVANIDGHVWTVRTKAEALAKIEEIEALREKIAGQFDQAVTKA